MHQFEQYFGHLVGHQDEHQHEQQGGHQDIVSEGMQPADRLQLESFGKFLDVPHTMLSNYHECSHWVNLDDYSKITISLQGYHYVLVRDFVTLCGSWCVNFIIFLLNNNFYVY